MLKRHPAVADAVVVGVPDERFGEVVTAVVEPLPGATIDPGALIDHVKAHLAAYKAPKQVIAVATIGRAANGKVDYGRLKEQAADPSGRGRDRRRRRRPAGQQRRRGAGPCGRGTPGTGGPRLALSA